MVAVGVTLVISPVLPFTQAPRLLASSMVTMGAWMVMKLVFVVVTGQLPAPVTVSFTSKLPVLVETCWGFCWVDVLPSPKSQSHCTGAPVVLSVKFTVSDGRQAAVLSAVKSGTGGLSTSSG